MAEGLLAFNVGHVPFTLPRGRISSLERSNLYFYFQYMRSLLFVTKTNICIYLRLTTQYIHGGPSKLDSC